jgi:signal peptidase I
MVDPAPATADLDDTGTVEAGPLVAEKFGTDEPDSGPVSATSASSDTVAPVVAAPVPAPLPSTHPVLRLAPPAPLLPAPPDPAPLVPDDEPVLDDEIATLVVTATPLVDPDLDPVVWEPAPPDRRPSRHRGRRAGEAPRRARRRSDRRRQPAPAEAKPWTRVAIEWLAIVAGALVTAMLVKALLLQAFVIPSRSMEPTLDVGDRVLVFKQSYSLGEVGRGDVIVFSRPAELRIGSERSDLIKRVIGLPGDVVEAREGRLLVNGAPLDEPWLADGARTDDFGPVTVPEGRLWVMGDNRGNSQDSRYFGFLDLDTIRGEAFLRWWPLARFGAL